jgi:hypothetical protein
MNPDIENIVYQIGLPLLKKVGGKFHFRCPICGDSKRNERKKRGWIIDHRGSYFYQCYNCGYNRPFHLFLRQYYHSLYIEYLKVTFKQERKTQHKEIPKVIDRIEYDQIEDIPRILDLDPEHSARRYLTERKIPFKAFSELFFTYNYQAWINTRVPKFETIPMLDCRVVLPIYSIHKKLLGAQGRSMTKGDIRYLTILFNEGELNVSGLDKVKRTEQIFVTEGFFDSLFLPNAISMNSSSVDLERLTEISNKDNFVFVYDNERRNREIKRRMEKVARAGFRIVVWPRMVIDWGKDINDMVLKNHDVHDIMGVMKENTFSGIEARTRIKLM